MIKARYYLSRSRTSQGIIQLYVRRGRSLSRRGDRKTLFDNVIKHLLDLGDFIGVTGFVFVTRTGETSIHAQTFTLLAKSPQAFARCKKG